MTKILLAVLTLAAFLYAAWLVILRRHLPDPHAAYGLRRKFLVAVGLFVLFLSGTTWHVATDMEYISCYAPAVTPIRRSKFLNTVRLVWRRLREEDAPVFAEYARQAAERGEMRHRDAVMLKVAFERLSFHKRATRGKTVILCYEPSYLGDIEYSGSEAALKQIELLRDLKEKGTLDQETLEKAHATLARELEALHLVRRGDAGIHWKDAKAMSEEYRAGGIEAGDTALVAAATILALEGVPIPEAASPAARLQTMRERVETLLLEDGPYGNDWRDPHIDPNVMELLFESELLPPPIQYDCYFRLAFPVQERDEELKRLQAKLLDKQVEAGVLDVETAERIRQANEKDDTPDFATEADIRAYQKKVRRIVRILYKRGEVPPSFVRELERAIALEIIDFDPAKALRDEMRWQLRSVLREPLGEAVLDALVERKLIPPAQNHRLVMKRRGTEPELPADDRARLEEILALIDGDEPIHLEGDGDSTIHHALIPETDREYILKMRGVLRALRKADVIRTDDALQRFGDILKLEMIGRLQSAPARREP